MIKSFLKEVGAYCLLMKKTFARPDNWRMVLKQVPTEMVKLGVDSVGIILISWHLVPSLQANRWGKNGNSGRFQFWGLQNNFRQLLQA